MLRIHLVRMEPTGVLGGVQLVNELVYWFGGRLAGGARLGLLTKAQRVAYQHSSPRTVKVLTWQLRDPRECSKDPCCSCKVFFMT